MVTLATNLRPPPDGVPPAVAPKMTEHTGMEPAKVWTVRDADLEPLIEWLHPKLLKRWPRCLEPSLRFWLKSAMADRLTRFVRSENVCAMVHVMADVKEPMPRVIENFLRGNEKAAEEERQMVYDHLASWAASIGAREFVFNVDSDARMARTSRGPGAKDILQDDRINRNVRDRPTFAVMFRPDD